ESFIETSRRHAVKASEIGIKDDPLPPDRMDQRIQQGRCIDFFRHRLSTRAPLGAMTNPRGRRLRGSHLRAGAREVVVVAAAEVDHRRRLARLLAGPELEDARGERGDELAVVRDEYEGPRVLVERG